MPPGVQRGGRVVGADGGSVRDVAVDADHQSSTGDAEGSAGGFAQGKNESGRDLAADGEGDPGWYQAPDGTLSQIVTAEELRKNGIKV